MSRRLETINTGYVDTSGVGQAYNQAYTQAKQLQWAEQDRQKKLQDEEDARLATGAAIYNKGLSQLEQYKGDLSTEEKVAFGDQFNSILSSYSDLQSAIAKGVKVGSAQYITMQTAIDKEKDALLMKIGALKEVNKADAQVTQNYGSGLITDPNVIKSIKDAKISLLKGTYINSMQIPKPQDVVMNSYVPAVRTINAFANGIKTVPVSTEDYIDGTKRIKKIERQIPVYSMLETSAQDKLNPANTDSRELTGVMKDASAFVNNPDAENSSQYQIYKLYMSDPAVKSDQMYKGIKLPKDFTPSDYLMMETISRRFIPTSKEAETLVKSSGARGAADAALGANIMNSMLGDLFGTDEAKKSAVISKLKGALTPKGWKIGADGNNVSILKTKDEYSDGISGTIKNTGDEEDKSLAMAMIKAYLTSIGKEGKMVIGKK